MVTVKDVANYILNRLGFVSTMKLQKLVYYSQARSLVAADAPLFLEDFQAWANGPVCADLFVLHRGRFIVGPGDLGLSVAENPLTSLERASIDRTLSVLGEYDGNDLSNLTHSESPWRDARGDTPEGERCQNVISKESIRAFYSSPFCRNPLFS